VLHFYYCKKGSFICVCLIHQDYQSILLLNEKQKETVVIVQWAVFTMLWMQDPYNLSIFRYIYLLLTLHSLHSTKEDADTWHCRETHACPSLLTRKTERADRSAVQGAAPCMGNCSLSCQFPAWFWGKNCVI